MSETQKYPLAWPIGQPRSDPNYRKDAQFAKRGAPDAGGYRSLKNLSIAEAMDRLRNEFSLMKVNFHDDCLVSSNLVLNMSGEPRSGQGEPKDPGVAVYWMTKTGQRRVMAIDIYSRVADNIAAVARTLEYMRGIERHGGAAVQERAFTGFAAIAPPKTCWQILAMDPPHSGEEKAKLQQRIKAAHRAGYIMLPKDTNGDAMGAAALNAARDDALRFAEGSR